MEFEGFIETSETTADYVLRKSPMDSVELGLEDRDGVVGGVLPDRRRVVVEVRATTLSSGQPLVAVVSDAPPSWIQPTPPSAATDPARWAMTDNGLYPSLDEPFSVLFSASVDAGPSDRDGDGVPDFRDDFPDDPAEWLDTDGDGTGNNADDDDDGDLMPDPYEVSHGLDPLVDDSAGNLDADPFTNGEEHFMGTAPDDPYSYLQVFVRVLPSGKWRVRWTVVPGHAYDFATSLDGEDYSVIYNELIAPAGAETLSHDFNAPTDTAPLFFQVSVD